MPLLPGSSKKVIKLNFEKEKEARPDMPLSQRIAIVMSKAHPRFHKKDKESEK